MGIPIKCDFLPGWDSGYTRRPKKEQNLRIGGAHGFTSSARPSGGFKGLRTWNVSCQISKIKGLENKGSSGHFVGEYIERPEECVIAHGDTPEEGKKKYRELEEKLFKQKKNSIIQRRLNIPLPKEILNSPEKTEKLLKTLQNNYFSSCYAFSAALHKGEKFKNPHIHVAYSNVDGNFKAIREFQDLNILAAMKKDIKNFIESELKIPCQMKGIGKSIKHYPKWVAAALKRAEEAEKRGDCGKMMKEYEERYPLFAQYLSERKRKKYERVIQLKESKLKKITEGEIMYIEEISENIKKKASGLMGKFYSKPEKEQIRKDLEINANLAADLKAKAKNLNFAAELEAKELEDQKRKAENRAQAQTKKPKTKNPDQEGLKPESPKTYYGQIQNLKGTVPGWDSLDKLQQKNILLARIKAFMAEFPGIKIDAKMRAWPVDNDPATLDRLDKFRERDTQAAMEMIAAEKLRIEEYWKNKLKPKGPKGPDNKGPKL